MKDRLGKLMTVKSLVTLTLSGTFVYMAAAGRITAQDFMTVFTVVIAFYFGTQAEKRNGGK